jgi:hypothetical protein
MTLFHVSEDPNIQLFEPRDPPTGAQGVSGKVVWAVDEAHLVNYLLPRDCPRVTFYTLPGSKSEDVVRLIGPSNAKHVVAIESGWFERAQQCNLTHYTLPPESFEVIDRGAGYHVSREPVAPLHAETITRPLDRILASGAELRVLPSLWSLCDAVTSSSLQFSAIRMRNASPRIGNPNTQTCTTPPCDHAS